MTDKNKKLIKALNCLEIFLLIALFVIISIKGHYSQVFIVFLFFTAAAILARLVLGVSPCNSKEAEKDENAEAKLIRELAESNRMLDFEKSEIEKELKTFKIYHEKISKNVAELFTLQVVSDTINSTLELDRLLNTVNDIIVGIMGVNTCTICIFEENQSGVRYLVSNEKRSDLLDNIRNRALFYLDKRDSLVEKMFVEEVSGFTPVTRITFTPVIKNKYVLGVIITGHTEDNLFDSEDARFLEIICNQISMAIENAKLYEKVNTMANTDFLTGLYNRTYFFNCFNKIFSEINEDQTLALAMFDIDNFKNVNDRYGHDTGDVVLKGLARIIKNQIRKDDIFARYGGEEFILVMQNITGEKGYERLNQIREAVQDKLFIHNGQSLSVTISIGAVYFSMGNDTQDTLIKKADLALYRAKKTGKNRIVVYEKGMES
ncbi:MAG: sensor domain-containing diguanylate cyclase [Desulfocucumaceae bacterium]